MIFCEPQDRDRALRPHDPFKALVVPRPAFAIETGEFVRSMATWLLRDAMNAPAASTPRRCR